MSTNVLLYNVFELKLTLIHKVVWWTTLATAPREHIEIWCSSLTTMLHVPNVVFILYALLHITFLIIWAYSARVLGWHPANQW